MGNIQSYRDLDVWKHAMKLGFMAYDATHAFPSHEQYALTSQIRRAAVSIASNIAEGYGRGGRAEYIRYLKIARGSLLELETQLLFARRFGYIETEQRQHIDGQLVRTAKTLAGLIRALER